MIHLYPANKMENLLALYNKIHQVSPLSVFDKETIIVQNQGMQHWLSMSIANSRGIAMNTGYALPAQFLWKLVRTMVGEENMADPVLFSRDVLGWRIYQLFGEKALNLILRLHLFSLISAL